MITLILRMISFSSFVNLVFYPYTSTIKVHHRRVFTIPIMALVSLFANIRALVPLLALAFDVWAFHGAGIGRARRTCGEAIVVGKRAVDAVEACVGSYVRAGKAT